MEQGAVISCASCGAPLGGGANSCAACGGYVSRVANTPATDVAVAGVETRAGTGTALSNSWHPLPIGWPSERNVAAVLAELLTRTRGVRVLCRVNREGLRDNDALLHFGPGDEVGVQVTVLVPYHGPWEQLARGRQSHEATPGQLAEQLRAALENSRDKVDPSQWLALDAMYLPRAGQPHVVAAYLARYGDPAREYGWKKVWIVGASTTTTVELALAGGLLRDDGAR